jgi:hypothetical protein
MERYGEICSQGSFGIIPPLPGNQATTQRPGNIKQTPFFQMEYRKL